MSIDHQGGYASDKSSSIYFPRISIYDKNAKRPEIQNLFTRERHIVRIRELENEIQHNFIESTFLGAMILIHMVIIVAMLVLHTSVTNDVCPYEYFLASNFAALFISLMGYASLRSTQIRIHQIFVCLAMLIIVNFIILFMIISELKSTYLSLLILGIFIGYIVVIFFSFRTIGILKRMARLRNLASQAEQLLNNQYA